MGVTWRDRIGGRWALSWQATALGTALVVVLATATGGGLVDWKVSDLPTVFSAAIVGGIAICVYVVIADVTVLRHRAEHPVPIPVAVGFHAGIGLLFGLVFAGVLAVFGLSLSESLTSSIIGFVLAGLWFCLTMTLILDARDRLVRERSQLLDEAVVLEVSHLYETRLASRVAAALDNAELPSRGTESLLPLHEMWRVSGQLRRPNAAGLEREVRESTSRLYPTPGLRDVTSALMSNGRLAPFETAAIVAIAYYRPTTAAWGLTVGLSIVVLAAGLIALATAQLNRWHTSGRSRLLAGMLVTLLITGSLVASFGAGVVTYQTLGLTVFALIGAFLFVVMPAAVGSLEAQYQQTNDRLREEMASLHRSQVQVIQSLADVAAAGGDQDPELLACAAGLRRAATSTDSSDVRSALEWSVAVLEDGADSPTHASVATRIADVASPWMALVTLSVNIEPAAGAIKGETAHACAVLLEDGMSLACGQAAANNVAITVKLTDALDRSSITMHIAHDGRPLTSADLPDDSRWHSRSPDSLGCAIPLPRIDTSA